MPAVQEHLNAEPLARVGEGCGEVLCEAITAVEFALLSYFYACGARLCMLVVKEISARGVWGNLPGYKSNS